MQINGRVSERFVAQARGVLALSILASMSAAGLSAPARAQNGCALVRHTTVLQWTVSWLVSGHKFQRDSCVTGARHFCCPPSMETAGVNCHWVGQSRQHAFWVCDAPASSAAATTPPPWVAIATNAAGGWVLSEYSLKDTQTVAVPDALKRCGNNCQIAAQGPGRMCRRLQPMSNWRASGLVGPTAMTFNAAPIERNEGVY